MHVARADGFGLGRDAYDTYFAPQGIGADLIATKYGFSRDDVDGYAAESQARAANAWEKGYFKNSVITVRDQLGMKILDRDEHMRPGTTKAASSTAPPACWSATRTSATRWA